MKQKMTSRVMTNIMESRLLCGNEKLYEKMRNATSPKKIWPHENISSQS